LENFTLFAWLATAGLFVGILVFAELGRRIGRARLVRDPEGLSKGIGAAEAAIFAMLGLVLAFSFSGAASRFEARRALVAVEANHIGTAWLRLGMLPADAQPPIRKLFRQYLDVRLATYRDGRDADRRVAHLAAGEALQSRIWMSTVAACKRPDTMAQAAILLLPALNNMIDITTTRLVATENHPPPVVFVLMALLGLVTALLMGYDTSTNRDRSVLHTWIFATILSLTFYVIIDLEFPRLGMIRVDAADRVLVDLRTLMGE
jgi:hypothetical protein